MQRLEVGGAVRPLYGSLGVKGLILNPSHHEPWRCSQLVITHDIWSYRNTTEIKGQTQLSGNNFHSISEHVNINGHLTLKYVNRISFSRFLNYCGNNGDGEQSHHFRGEKVKIMLMILCESVQ